MDFIYRDDVFDAITETLLENNSLRYSPLYDSCTHILNCKISHTIFGCTLNKMFKEKLLDKNEVIDSKLKIKPVYYSLTLKAKKKSTLRILGIDERTQSRKNLYRLLIFFEIFKSRDPLTKRQLFRFLNQIRISRDDLQIAKEYNASFPKVTHYKPIRDVEIIRWIQTDSNVGYDTPCYHVVIPGFTVNEFTSYLKKLKKWNEPQPFFSHLGITNVPFVLYSDYTKSEIAHSIESFLNDGIIKLVNDVFPGEMRYKIADESLVSFIKDIWSVHDIDLRLLFERLIYDGKPKDDDRNYLILLYGKKIADRLLSNAYDLRKSYKQKKDREEEKIAKEFIQDLASHRTSLVQDIIKRHQKVLKKYDIASELIERICSSPIISQDPSQN